MNDFFYLYFLCWGSFQLLNRSHYTTQQFHTTQLCVCDNLCFEMSTEISVFPQPACFQTWDTLVACWKPFRKRKIAFHYCRSWRTTSFTLVHLGWSLFAHPWSTLFISLQLLGDVNNRNCSFIKKFLCQC